jgi:hypothetical protein
MAEDTRTRIGVQHDMKGIVVAIGGSSEQVKLRSRGEFEISVAARNQAIARRIEVGLLVWKNRGAGVAKTLDDVASALRESKQAESER